MHDRDTKFTAKFNATLKDAGLRVKLTAYRSPNTNAYVERFIQTLKQECLNPFIVFGQRHMDHPCSTFVDYYHRFRPHQAKDNELLVSKRKPKKKAAAETISLAEVRCQQQLRGLLKS